MTIKKTLTTLALLGTLSIAGCREQPIERTYQGALGDYSIAVKETVGECYPKYFKLIHMVNSELSTNRDKIVSITGEYRDPTNTPEKITIAKKSIQDFMVFYEFSKRGTNYEDQRSGFTPEEKNDVIKLLEEANKRFIENK